MASASSPIPTTAAESSQPTHYLITLKRSPIGLPDTSKQTLAALGFLPSSKHFYPKGPKASANPKLNRSVLHPFSETAAGMILKVKELVEVRNVSREAGEMEVVRRNGSKGEGRGWEVAGSYRDV
jgi:ribosomal protein L30/L7E